MPEFSGLASLEDRQAEELREPGFFLPAGFSLHEGGLGVICMYGNCGGNGNFTDREGRSIKAISGDLLLGVCQFWGEISCILGRTGWICKVFSGLLYYGK